MLTHSKTQATLCFRQLRALHFKLYLNSLSDNPIEPYLITLLLSGVG